MMILFIIRYISFIKWFALFIKKNQVMLNHRGIQVGDLKFKPTELFGF